ncbi:hypothetical protein TRFO_38833 [Tritrichomonas foetus]|uniref:Uncharacterized protein n=1 Tax=Tritrichomonas foetus TaxID=1144522 RepID=A0A1J4JBD4_9EUKA|nr:hypothetical protein TRFO_38833 [Tritrichomonas foetus]|eukprot:OHS94971.1 hypothetical protein TRFO_38833 [Tritrichomonas foetus]
MPVENRAVALAYRSLSMVIVLVGVLLSLGLFQGRIYFRLLIYFTTQSNIWCFIFFVFLTVQTFKDLKKNGIKGQSNISPLIRGQVTMAIIATHVIYHFILAPHRRKTLGPAGFPFAYQLQNYFVHYITPFLTVFDYIVFSEKNIFNIVLPFTWLVLPYIYLAVAMTVAEYIPSIPGKTSRYPYFFIDVDAYGVKKVIKNIIGLSVAILVLAYVIVLFDKLSIKDCKLTFRKKKESGKKNKKKHE